MSGQKNLFESTENRVQIGDITGVTLAAIPPLSLTAARLLPYLTDYVRRGRRELTEADNQAIADQARTGFGNIHANLIELSNCQIVIKRGKDGVTFVPVIFPGAVLQLDPLVQLQDAGMDIAQVLHDQQVAAARTTSTAKV
jgi:hypothetical protein